MVVWLFQKSAHRKKIVERDEDEQDNGQTHRLKAAHLAAGTTSEASDKRERLSSSGRRDGSA
jgi:hypothetical protein